MKAEDKNMSAETTKQKTKYDRKMEARRLQEAKDKREAMISKTIGTIVLIAIIAAAALLIGSSVIKKNHVMNDTYVMVGDIAVTEHEYDFYYNTYVNQYLSVYGSYLSYMGLDTTKSFAEQEYADGMTWKDAFDESTVSMLINTKVMYQDAVNNGFVYDTTAEYEEYKTSIETNAQTAGVSVGRYYKLMYGDYATVANVKPYIEEGLIADAYYNKLLEDNKPSDEAVKSFYEANKNQYDLASFYSYSFTATTSEEDGQVILSEEQAKEQAYEMATRAEKEDFEALCLEYALDSEKPSYEPEDTEFSLSTGKTFSSIDSNYSNWIYEQGRTEGEVAVFEDTENQTYHVVKFVSVEYDETCVDTISNSLAAENADIYVTELIENYQITDVKGELAYLTAGEEATVPADDMQEIAGEEATVLTEDVQETVSAEIAE